MKTSLGASEETMTKKRQISISIKLLAASTHNTEAQVTTASLTDRASI